METILKTVDNFVNRWKYLSDKDKNMLIEVQEKIATARNNAKEIKWREEEQRKREQSRRRSETYKNRESFMSKYAPIWCKENLKVGDLVKVKAKNSSLRKIKEHGSKSMMAAHMEKTYVGRDQETRNHMYEYREGRYITDHLYKNITQIMIDGKWTPLYAHLKKVYKDV